MDAHVWFYETFAEEEAALRALLPPSTSAGFSRHTIQETDHDAPPAPLLSIRTQSVVPAAWFPAIEAIVSRSAGADHLHALRARGFSGALGCLDDYCARAVAEHALLLALALLRRLPRQCRQLRRFDREGLTGSELAGRRVAVVGVGRIGGTIVQLFTAVGADVVGVDPVERYPLRYLPPDRALPWLEVLILAMDLNPSSDGWLHADRLDALSPGTLLINVARGELTPHTTLLRGLRSGRLAGVALDVFEAEPALAADLRAGRPPDPVTRALLEHPAVIATPHNAFNTAEALHRKAAQTIAQVQSWLVHHRFHRPLEHPPARAKC